MVRLALCPRVLDDAPARRAVAGAALLCPPAGDDVAAPVPLPAGRFAAWAVSRPGSVGVRGFSTPGSDRCGGRRDQSSVPPVSNMASVFHRWGPATIRSDGFAAIVVKGGGAAVSLPSACGPTRGNDTGPVGRSYGWWQRAPGPKRQRDRAAGYVLLAVGARGDGRERRLINTASGRGRGGAEAGWAVRSCGRDVVQSMSVRRGPGGRRAGMTNVSAQAPPGLPSRPGRALAGWLV